MCKILKLYEDSVDKVWYDSSNILYSECNDKKNDFKDVKIVFKNGSTYKYNDVNVMDYLLFREDASNGKAFIKYIKKYAFEKLDDTNIEDIKNELKTLLEENKEKDEIN